MKEDTERDLFIYFAGKRRSLPFTPVLPNDMIHRPFYPMVYPDQNFSRKDGWAGRRRTEGTGEEDADLQSQPRMARSHAELTRDDGERHGKRRRRGRGAGEEKGVEKDQEQN